MERITGRGPVEVVTHTYEREVSETLKKQVVPGPGTKERGVRRKHQGGTSSYVDIQLPGKGSRAGHLQEVGPGTNVEIM